MSRHDELRVKKQVGKGIIRKVGGKRKGMEVLTVCPRGPVGFLQLLPAHQSGQQVIPGLVANNNCVEIKFSLRESQHMCHSTRSAGKHTSLNQILCNVHFQPEGGSNSVNKDHHVVCRERGSRKVNYLRAPSQSRPSPRSGERVGGRGHNQVTSSQQEFLSEPPSQGVQPCFLRGGDGEASFMSARSFKSSSWCWRMEAKA